MGVYEIHCRFLLWEQEFHGGFEERNKFCDAVFSSDEGLGEVEEESSVIVTIFRVSRKDDFNTKVE